MIRTLTKEEIEEADEEYNHWWHSLSMVDKSNIYHFCKVIINSESVVGATEALEEIKNQKNN